jgi:DNA-binding MarR family transcriptional regulator
MYNIVRILTKGGIDMDIHLFHQFADRVLRDFTPHLEDPLRPREVHLLMVIDQEPDKPLRFYARHVGLERGSFTYLTEVMEHRGYVKRKEDEQDRRKKTLELTELGQRVIADAKVQMDKHLETLFKSFTEDDKEDLQQAYTIIERLLPKLPKRARRMHRRPYLHHPPHHPDHRPHPRHKDEE